MKLQGRTINSSKMDINTETAPEARNLDKMHAILSSMLKTIDIICQEHDITYWLDAGTLLGAVRHKGFIPWDDDVDLAVPRHDFCRFMQVMRKALPETMLLEAPISGSDYERNIMPCKIRHAHSRVKKIGARGEIETDRGLFIDIFPIDKFHPRGVKKHLDRSIHCIYRRLYGWQHADFKRLPSKRIANNALVAIRPVLPIKTLFTMYQQYLLRYIIPKRQKLNQNAILGYSYDTYLTRYFKHESIYPLIKMEFDGHEYNCPQNHDDILRAYYGDYQTVPAFSDRQKPHFEVITLADESCTSKNKNI